MAEVNISQIAEMDRGLISEATKIRYYPFVAATGDGARLTDVEGKEYLDFTGSWALANTGYSHPVVKQHIIDQLNRTTFASLVSGMHETALNLAERLTEIVPELVVLDLHLPGVGGTTILDQIRSDPRLAPT